MSRSSSVVGDLALIAIYCAGIVGANAVVTHWGQAALPFTAVILIPMDLVVRDLLQDRWSVKAPWKLRLFMGVLIVGGSALAFITTVATARIALASAVAFSLTGLIDALTYQAMIRQGRILRINLATLVAAITDSVVFALIAFEHPSKELVAAQVLFKIAGGAMWSLLLFPLFRKPRTLHETFREYQEGLHRYVVLNGCRAANDARLSKDDWMTMDEFVLRVSRRQMRLNAELWGPSWIDSLPKYRGGS